MYRLGLSQTSTDMPDFLPPGYTISVRSFPVMLMSSPSER